MFTLGFEKTAGPVGKMLGTKSKAARSEAAQNLKRHRNWLRKQGPAQSASLIQTSGAGKGHPLNIVIQRKGQPHSISKYEKEPDGGYKKRPALLEHWRKEK